MKELLDNLNPEQLQAVTHSGGSLLIIAGAGTGKTTVITRKFAYIVSQGWCKPEQILALTFTDKAAGEMEDRVIQLLPIATHDLWVSTFHSFCERILRQYALEIGLNPDFELFDEVRQWQLIYKNLDKFKLDYYKPSHNPYKFVSAMLKHFSKCKDELIAPQDYLDFAQSKRLEFDSPEVTTTENGEEQLLEAKKFGEISEAYFLYNKLLAESDALDFGDLINETIRLFKQRPNVLAKIRASFKYVMVDEFQDTNFAQYELIKFLTHSPFASCTIPVKTAIQNPGSQVEPGMTTAVLPELTVVGDDDQSIYKFRGASVSNILHFLDDYSTAAKVTLTKNYRSTQNILDLAWNFIQLNNPDRLEVKLGINKRLEANKEGAGEVIVLEGKDNNEETHLVVENILKIKLENPTSTWNDFAILVRSNSQTEELLPVLEKAGIPFTYLSNVGLYKKPFISMLVSYLRLLDNYHESMQLYQVLNFPKFKLDGVVLSDIFYHKEKRALSLYAALKDPELVSAFDEDSRKKVDNLLELIHKHTALSQDVSASELFIDILADLSILDLLKEDTLDNSQNREWLDQFYKRIESFEKDNTNHTLKAFLEDFDLELKAGGEGEIKFDPDSGPETLKVMTIHSSKGLEFEYVFLPGMIDQKFPSRRRADLIEIPDALARDILPTGDSHMEDERRLFYVAVTRARTKLFFSWAPDYGGSRARKPSEFLVAAKLVPGPDIVKATGKVVFQPRNSFSEKAISDYKRLPEKFSFSEISCFEKCPLEYKYRYYFKFPVKGAGVLSFGITIHKVLEKYLKEYASTPGVDLFGSTERVLPAKSRLMELYADEWVDDWYESKQQKEIFREKGIKILNNFYSSSLTNLPKIKFLELPFEVRLDKFVFRGTIDRIDEGETGVKILDYKTGKVPDKPNFEQLRIYEWALSENFDLKTSELNFWYLDENKFVECEPTKEKDLIKIQNKLLEIANQIVDCVKYDCFEELHAKVPQHDCKYS